MSGPTLAADQDSDEELLALYRESVFKDVAELERLSAGGADDAESWPERQTRMREITHNVKGQGASFGYPLITRVGESLSRLLKLIATPDESSLKLVTAHVSTLRTVLDQDIKGDGGDLGDDLACRLEALVDKLDGSVSPF